MIRLDHVERSFRDHVLKGINLTFEEGKVYVIKGVSGCGKTTLLNIIAGLDLRYRGNYFVDGNDRKNFSRSEEKEFRSRIGYITQESLLLANISVYDNLCFFHQNPPETVKYYMEEYAIGHLCNRLPDHLSGGERQRVSIVRALLSGAELFIADEPTSALDAGNAAQAVEDFRRLAGQPAFREGGRRPCIIIATHKDIFDEIADEVIFLHYGRVESINCMERQADADNAVHPAPAAGKNSRMASVRLLRRFMAKRHPLRREIPTLAVLAVFFCFIMAAVSVKSNYRNEMLRLFAEEYPCQVFSLSEEAFEKLSEPMELEKLQGCMYGEEEVAAYALLDREDSIFKAPGMLSAGHFPENNRQVIVSAGYAQKHGDGREHGRLIGKRMELHGREYEISGVAKSCEEVDQAGAEFIYYPKKEGCHVFVPQKELKEYGTQENNGWGEVMARIPLDYYLDKNWCEYMEKNYFEAGFVTWLSIFENKTSRWNYYADCVLIMCIAAGGAGLLFLYNQINLELYYRRREIGCFQLFGMSRGRLYLLFLYQYGRKMAAAYLAGIMVFLAGAAAVFVRSSMLFLLSPAEFMAIFSVLLAYTVTVVSLPVCGALRKDILSLIR